MQALLLNVVIPKTMLATTRTAHGPTTDSGTYNYYISSYIGSCQYRFEFSPNNTHDGIIPRDNTLGSLVIQMEAKPWDGHLPVDDINKWRMI